MAIFTDITEAWSAGTVTAAAEVWQCRAGAVFLTVEAAPVANDGIRLDAGDGVQIAAGKTVRYRRATRTASIIAREVFQ
jgi:hypothetical protein